MNSGHSSSPFLKEMGAQNVFILYHAKITIVKFAAGKSAIDIVLNAQIIETMLRRSVHGRDELAETPPEPPEGHPPVREPQGTGGGMKNRLTAREGFAILVRFVGG